MIAKREHAILAAGVFLLATTAHAQFWRISPNGGLYSDGVSDNGAVSGSSNQYFVWTNGSGTTLIGGTPPGDGTGGLGKISNNGQRISGTYLNPASGKNEAAFYDVGTGTWTALGGLGGYVDGEISSGWSVSGNGNQIVGLGWLPDGNAHAIRANLGGVVDLGSTVAGRASRANAVDLDGNVIGGWQDADTGFRQGAVWVDGVQELISKTDGSAAFEVFAVSNDGQWVTGWDTAGFFGVGNAYRYNTVTDIYESLPNLFDGMSNMAGAGITDDGDLIVGGTWGFGPAYWGTGLIWREGIGTVSFKDYLDDQGITYPADYNFNYVSDVSSDGKWFTGWGGTSPAGALESWAVYVPEPASGLLLGFLVLGLMRRR